MKRFRRRGARALGISCLMIWALAAAGNAPAQERAEGYTVRWVQDAADEGRAHVQVEGLSDDTLQRLREAGWPAPSWTRLLAVTTDARGAPPMLGAYSIEPNGIRFDPAFPLDPGRTYHAVFAPRALPGDPTAEDAPISASFRPRERSSSPATAVSAIYPRADVVPENLLKFYVHFSAPMRRGGSYKHIHLLNSGGEEQELPFLEIDEELWDPTLTRLTLFIDPGRIKRELLPRRMEGPALEAGRRYRLVIDDTWLDANGVPLKESFLKEFTVGSPDHDPPDPEAWRISSPSSNTRQPLVVTFREPMDHALALRMITVRDRIGAYVDGEVDLTGDEQTWTLVPSRPWAQGPHDLVVQTTIEDLAGNNIGKPFDVDLFDGVTRQITGDVVRVEFNVR